MDRRTFLATTGTVLAGGLAGCTGGDGGGSDDDPTAAGDGGATTTETDGTTTAGDGTTAAGATSPYTVSMEPMGAVEFEAVPETVTLYFPGYADMAVALGHGDAVQSVGLPSRYHTDVYDELDGVAVDEASLTALYQGGVDKETFLELDSDLHLMDPNWLLNNFKGWERGDIDTLRESVAPFLGNVIFRRTDAWHDYRYYSMYEAFETVAQVFQEQARFQRFKSFHDDVIADVQANLPGPDSRPNAALLWQGTDEPESFYPYRLSGKGTNKKQFHDLGITDAFAATGIDGLSTSDRGTVDYEALLEVDPDSILLRGHETKSREAFQSTVVAFMEDHSVASQLTAVQEGRVFRGGPIYEGPIQNLFLTERYATGYYPDTFGGELFDRDELASIVTG